MFVLIMPFILICNVACYVIENRHSLTLLVLDLPILVLVFYILIKL